MSSNNYCIRRTYRARRKYCYFDDRSLTDEWQREVYLAARDLMREEGLRSVVDVGCGSAYKLLTYLGEFETTGLDVSPTYEWLVEKHPDRNWVKSDFAMPDPPSADLVISADVIEHLLDPDQLLDFIARMNFRYLVLSTPTRDLLYPFWRLGYWGPPMNRHHIREWSFKEFGEYISQHFDVLRHEITHRRQTTQMIIARKKAGG